MLPAAEETAILIAVMFKRSEEKRARVSKATIRRLSKRRNIRDAFLFLLKLHLNDLGLVLVDLDRGGYGLIPSRALEGAPAISAKKFMQDVVHKRYRIGELIKEIEEDVVSEESSD